METALKVQIADQAAGWFARLQDPAATDSDRDEFSMWMLRSPEHVREYLLAMHAWGELRHTDPDKYSVDSLVRDALADDSQENVRTLPVYRAHTFAAKDSTANRADRPRGLKFLAAAAFATLAITLGILANQWLFPSNLRTAIGEQRSVTLADGSVIHLNTDSEVHIDLAPERRQLYLLKGEARFTVMKDAARPFVVVSDNASIKALGTVFNIRKSRGETAVAVLEGRVEVGATSSPALVMHAGERAAITSAGAIVPDAGPPLHRAIDWTERRLVFREETLAVVAEEANRYHEDHIVLVSPDLASLRISGAFSANDLQSLIDYLKHYHNVRVKRDARGNHLLATDG